MKIDITREIQFKTARSGGKGGQNVNKVETMVEGSFDVSVSALLTDEQKGLVLEKLATRINSDGILQVRSQTHRSQLKNKEEVIKKMNQLIEKALQKKKKRIATRPTAVSREKRLTNKKKLSEAKEGRKKIRNAND